MDLCEWSCADVSYVVVSAALALEEGMSTFLFLQKKFNSMVVSGVIIMYQCKTSIKGCNKLLLCIRATEGVRAYP